jgi:hypothetical protein
MRDQTQSSAEEKVDSGDNPHKECGQQSNPVSESRKKSSETEMKQCVSE